MTVRITEVQSDWREQPFVDRLGRCVGFDRGVGPASLRTRLLGRPAKREIDLNIDKPGVVLQMRRLIRGRTIRK